MLELLIISFDTDHRHHVAFPLIVTVRRLVCNCEHLLCRSLMRLLEQDFVFLFEFLELLHEHVLHLLHLVS